MVFLNESRHRKELLMRNTEKQVRRFFVRVDSIIEKTRGRTSRFLSAAFYLPYAFEALGWCQESNTDDAVIPGLAESARQRFDYKLLSDVGRSLYAHVKLNVREARKASKWKWFRFRVSRFCRLFIAHIGFMQVLQELDGDFDEGQRRALRAISNGINQKLSRLETVLSRSRHAERWRQNPSCVYWNSVHPMADFLS